MTARPASLWWPWIALSIPVALFVVATGLRIASSPRLDFDEHIFLDVGTNLVHTGLPIRTYRAPTQLFFDHTPLYVYVVGALTALSADASTLARALSAVLGFGTVVLVFAIGREARGPLAGLLGASVLALTPFFITYAWFVRMEGPLAFSLVLATWALLRRRLIAAGLAIAAAVMLKEIALAFWIVASAFELWRSGWRNAVVVGAPAPIAFVGWLIYAAYLDATGLSHALRRWLGSAAGGDTDPRLLVPAGRWTRMIAIQIVGWREGLALAASVILALPRLRSVPPIAIVPAAYVVVAILSSYVIRLKEPRYLIGIVPMIALLIALLVDWDGLAAAGLERGQSFVARRAAKPSAPRRTA